MPVCLLSSLVFWTLQLNVIKKQNQTKNQIWEKGSYKGGVENYMATFLVAVAKTSDWRTLLAGFTLAPGLKVVRAWCQALEATAWIASAIKKQKALNAGAQLAFSFLLIPGPQTMECCPYTEWLFRINWPNLETTSRTRSKVFLRVAPGPVKMTILATGKVNRGGSTSNKMLCSAVWCCRGVGSCYNRRERWPQRKW